MPLNIAFFAQVTRTDAAERQSLRYRSKFFAFVITIFFSVITNQSGISAQ